MGRPLLLQDEMTRACVQPVVVWANRVSTDRRVDGLDELVLRCAAQGQNFIPTATRDAVRQMLRHGRYKPSGRGKPASEFLLQAALNGVFPKVNGPVDVNNAVSLEAGLPASIFDADVAGDRLFVRRGLPGESYVFNPSGQSIDLEDLLVVCRWMAGRWAPCGNPVKDAMETKIRPETGRVVAVLYVPRVLGDEIAACWGARFRDVLAETCAAEDSGFALASEAGGD
ncbi:MAG: phenylalanine--tRNA ligase beta subunit-related protein [Candidatus Bipolaricaulota bacterium]